MNAILVTGIGTSQGHRISISLAVVIGTATAMEMDMALALGICRLYLAKV